MVTGFLLRMRPWSLEGEKSTMSVWQREALDILTRSSWEWGEGMGMETR
jgi:hypothetical protein